MFQIDLSKFRCITGLSLLCDLFLGSDAQFISMKKPAGLSAWRHMPAVQYLRLAVLRP